MSKTFEIVNAGNNIIHQLQLYVYLTSGIKW